MTAEGEIPPDHELVEKLRDRDEEVFRLIVTEWSGGMQRLARQFVSTADSAAEVVQETWIAVIQGLDSFEGRSALRTWACTILVNTARRRASREGRSIPWSSLGGDDDDDGDPTVDPARFRGSMDADPGHWLEFPDAWSIRSPESELLREEFRSEVGFAVDSLPHRQGVVVTLRDVLGYRAEEVSSILDISTSNQRVLLHRARAAVRLHLESYFGASGGSADRNPVQ